MDDVVYDVSYEIDGVTLTALGRTSPQAIDLLCRHHGARVRARKLLPCAQRLVTARIATLPPAGTTPANPAGGGDL